MREWFRKHYSQIDNVLTWVALILSSAAFLFGLTSIICLKGYHIRLDLIISGLLGILIGWGVVPRIIAWVKKK